jgi:hypothetical protein
MHHFVFAKSLCNRILILRVHITTTQYMDTGLGLRTVGKKLHHYQLPGFDPCKGNFCVSQVLLESDSVPASASSRDRCLALSSPLLLSSLLLFFGNYLFSAIIRLHLFNSNLVSMAVHDEELESVCVTPKTSFAWSSLQIQLQMGCEKGEIQSSMNFFLLNY